MKKRPLRVESLEERQLLAVTAGFDASALPEPTAPAPAGYAVGDVYIASTVDADGDGFIGPSELSYMSYAWFAADGSENWNPASDLDGDGFIGPGDYALLSSYWFKTNDRLPGETKSYAIYPSDISNWYLFGDKVSKVSARGGTLSLDARTETLEAVCDYEEFAENLRVTADFTPSGGTFSAGIELDVQENGQRYYAEFQNEKAVLYLVGEGEEMTQLRSAKRHFENSETYTIWFQSAGGQLACGIGEETLLAIDGKHLSGGTVGGLPELTPVPVDGGSLSGGMVGFYASAGIGKFSNITVEFDPDRVENTPEEEPTILRFVTFNIRACQGLNSSYGVNPALAGGVLNDLAPDVAGLQEVDRNTKRSGYVDQITVLGEMTGLSPVYAKAINYGGGEYGIGVLTGLPIVSTRRVSLPGAEEARALVEVEFDDFVLFNTHLSLTASSRTESAVIIKNELARYDKPVILLGDMNEATGIRSLFGDVWTVIGPVAPTFPADSPTVQYDYVLIADPTGAISVNSPIWTDAVEESGVVSVIASDHRPVYVDLNLTKILENL
ncbi:MAG: hypothetical protein J6S40_06390 [Thermoguttaceae bacterium]|nr:hypothetical protein [Thermoguttaceae bacterium]